MFNLMETEVFIEVLEELLEKADTRQKIALTRLIAKLKALKRSIETGGLGGD